MKYLPGEIRPEGDWVVFMMPSTLVLRLFRSENDALDRYGKKSLGTNVFPDYTYLIRGFKGKELVRIFNEFCKTLCGDSTGREAMSFENLPEAAANNPTAAAKRLWELLQVVGNKHKPKNNPTSMSMSKGRNYEYVFDTSFINSAEGQRIIEGYCRQKQALIKGLIFAKVDRIKRQDLKLLIRQLHDQKVFKTRTNPWDIWAYYAVEYARDGFVNYHGLKNKENFKCNLQPKD